MPEQFDSIYWRGQGPLGIARRDAAGNHLGFVFVGDVESIEGTPNISRTDVKENVTGQRTTAASFITDQSIDLSINFKSVKPAHLAQALQADLTSVAAGSAVSEAITAFSDKMSPLDNVKVSTVVVKDVTDTTTYVAGTDYIAHLDEGVIEVLSTGAIADLDVLHVSYDYAAQEHLSANPQNEDLMLQFDGINTTNSDKRGRCTVYKVNIDPAFLSLVQQDTEGALTVNAKLLVDNLRQSGDQQYGWKFES